MADHAPGEFSHGILPRGGLLSPMTWEARDSGGALSGLRRVPVSHSRRERSWYWSWCLLGALLAGFIPLA